MRPGSIPGGRTKQNGVIKMGIVKDIIGGFMLGTVLTSIIVIIIATVFFTATLFIVSMSSNLVFGIAPDPNWAVLAAAIISVGSIMTGSFGTR